MKGGLRWPLLIVASTIAVAAFLAADVHGAPRVLATLWFLFVCTGMAFVPLLGLRSLGRELALGFVLSLIVDMLVVVALLAAGGLSATNGLVTLAALCLIGCTLQLLLLPLEANRRTSP